MAGAPAGAAPLRALLARCEAEIAAAPEPAPIRILHHFACTGGTLIARALSTMPNTTLLSEIDPLSPLDLPAPGRAPAFRPHALVYNARVALRPVDDAQAAAVFTAGLEALHGALAAQGRHLVLRDHAHSQFCTRADPAARPTLAALTARVAPVRGAVTVRHPMDSFLSLTANNWVHFTPGTLEGYARRYHAFLDAHAGLPVLRYEDLIADPDRMLARLCEALALPFRAGAEAHLPVVRMSGDSGRRGDRIAPRPRKPVPEALAEEARGAPAYAALCARLGYDEDGCHEG